MDFGGMSVNLTDVAKGSGFKGFVLSASSSPWVSAIGGAADAIGGFLPERTEYSGDKGAITKGMDAAYDKISDAIANVPVLGTAASALMKGRKLLGLGINAIGGGTDGMTTLDAILGSAFLQTTPLGWINGAFGKHTDTIKKNELTQAAVGASYSGAYEDIDNSVRHSDKKYGLLSQNAMKEQNALIHLSGRNQNYLSTMANNVNMSNNVLANLMGTASAGYAASMSGGYNLADMRAAKQGMKFFNKEQVKRTLVILAKKKRGGVIEYTPFVFDFSSLNNLVLKALNGTQLPVQDDLTSEDYLKYAISRFPKLASIADNVKIGFDPKFDAYKLATGLGDIEYSDDTEGAIRGLPTYYLDKDGNYLLYNYKNPNPGKISVSFGSDLLKQDPEIRKEAALLDLTTHGLRSHDLLYLDLWKILSDSLYDNEDLRRETLENIVNLAYNHPDASGVFREDIDTLRKSFLNEDGEEVKFTDIDADTLDLLKLAYPWFNDFYNNLDAWGNTVDGVVRNLLVNPQLTLLLKYAPKEVMDKYIINTPEARLAADNIILYLMNAPEKYAQGGSIIPEGALHARKHHLEDIRPELDGLITKKGIPVIIENGGQIELLAEIELNEIILSKKITELVEDAYKKYFAENTTEKELADLAIEIGKLLTHEILYNTDDKTNLIDTVE